MWQSLDYARSLNDTCKAWHNRWNYLSREMDFQISKSISKKNFRLERICSDTDKYRSVPIFVASNFKLGYIAYSLPCSIFKFHREI
jgi:hypothetical protein